MKPLVITEGNSVSVDLSFNEQLMSFTSAPNGWINNDVKKEWFKLFLEYIKPSTKNNRFNLLLADGHESNFNPEIQELAIKNNVIILIFPAHTTHILQPLDNHYFHKLKLEIKHQKNRDEYKDMAKDFKILKFIEEPLYHASSPQSIQDSFRIAGIYPPRFKEECIHKSFISFQDWILKKSTDQNNSKNTSSQNSSSQNSSSQNNSSHNSSHLIQNNIQYPEVNFSEMVSTTTFPDNSSYPLAPSVTNRITQLSINPPSQSILECLVDQVINLGEEVRKLNTKKSKSPRISTHGGVIITDPEHNQAFIEKKLKRAEKNLKESEKNFKQNQTELNALKYKAQLLLSPSDSQLALPSSDSQLALPSPSQFQFLINQVVLYNYPSLSNPPKWVIGKITKITEDKLFVIKANVDTTRENDSLKWRYRFLESESIDIPKSSVKLIVNLSVKGTIKLVTNDLNFLNSAKLIYVS